ncbi:GNAT family N-acetyltransferase [Agrobacterium vitis]|uniref:GNAT family N-acetyltransferase n=1 Tax=Agrobacterium vitis TaxID=373 RepID=A0A368P1M7_AGRVI|nr:GNAT family N-acetyltransferase [Agrobacterium vitis]KAA3518731.1 GNAT family N-acetyltransferase [Agrobacterium vitis]KAA3530327.1 GNAT family N-acetyltransferase [Agrobacterium vitis]MCF1476263.1 GNAT family N-acetyltransferase [Agrobacterium vitis]MUZ98961.1 GNAT family N-acetyltransferase [Agrobacterium vitis]MVA31482.1 GNAT family N-acetyltransferase [Agrobacterium vitis]
MTVKTSIQVESFELTLTDIHDVGIDRLHGLSVAVGWPHRTEDWAFLLANGQGVAAIDPIDRVLGSAMWFPMDEHFATIGMVITSPRLQTQGTGRWLMDHILGNISVARLGLNSTRAARRLYRSIGFAVEAPVFQCQGEARLPPETAKPADGAELRAITSEDLPEIATLDEIAFGANRQRWLGNLLPLSEGVVLLRAGKIVAFALSRPFGRGHVVGPVVAASDEDAIAVTRPHVARYQGRFLRLDTRHGSGAFAEFLQESGLSLFDTVTTMSLRAPWPVGPKGEPDADDKGHSGPHAITYGLASQALG